MTCQPAAEDVIVASGVVIVWKRGQFDFVNDAGVDWPKPYFMLAAGVCAAATDDEARYLRSSQMLAFARVRTGRPGKLPHPVADLSAEIAAPVLAQVE